MLVDWVLRIFLGNDDFLSWLVVNFLRRADAKVDLGQSFRTCSRKISTIQDVALSELDGATESVHRLCVSSSSVANPVSFPTGRVEF